MRTQEVYDALANQWALNPEELEILRSGRPLYRHEIRWARQELVIEGKILPRVDSGHGVWMVRPWELQDAHTLDEDVSGAMFTEGSLKKITVNAYERNARARKRCLEFYGYDCKVCGFNFETTYGTAGRELIHVHHKIEISSIGREYVLDPIEDLVPVCANCHLIIHRRRDRAFTIEEVQRMLQS